MTSDDHSRSLADQAADWVPPWERSASPEAAPFTDEGDEPLENGDADSADAAVADGTTAEDAALLVAEPEIPGPDDESEPAGDAAVGDGGPAGGHEPVDARASGGWAVSTEDGEPQAATPGPERPEAQTDVSAEPTPEAEPAGDEAVTTSGAVAAPRGESDPAGVEAVGDEPATHADAGAQAEPTGVEVVGDEAVTTSDAAAAPTRDPAGVEAVGDEPVTTSGAAAALTGETEPAGVEAVGLVGGDEPAMHADAGAEAEPAGTESVGDAESAPAYPVEARDESGAEGELAAGMGAGVEQVGAEARADSEAGDGPPVPLALAGEAELRGALEAILLVVEEPVGEIMLAQVLEQPTERIAALLATLAAEYEADGRGFELRKAAGGWRLYTRPEYAPYVERFVLDGQQVRLTQAALETLAVVAYKQPVTRSRISAIRGVNCDGVIRTLISRGLVEECGTEPDSGAFLYRTTTLFLEKLGLESVEDLPPLAPFLPDDVDEMTDASN